MDFTLRPWTNTPTDAASLVKHANNSNIARFMTDGFPHPYTLAAAGAFLGRITQDVPVHILAIDVAGEAVGSIGFFQQADIMRKNAEMGYWLSQQYWGRGIVTEAVKRIIPLAFSTYDIDRLFARPYGNNPASQRVLEKAGFTFETRFEKTIFKNGEYLDELFYAVRRSDQQIS